MKSLYRLARHAVPMAAIALATACPVDDPTRPDGTLQVLYFLDQNVPATVGVGERVQLVVRMEDDEGDEVSFPVSWTTSNAAIASIPVSNGAAIYVTGISAGTATISAAAEGKTASRQVVVSSVVQPQSGIVFSSTRDGNSEIYMLAQDGPHNLTQNAAADLHPTVHGTKIYFSSDRSGNFEIYSMNLDGSSVTRLTNNAVADNWPAAGTSKLAFSRDVGSGREQIFTMNFDGSNQSNISNNSFHEGTPAWSPDGSKLVYASDRDAKYGPLTYLEIYSMNADGTGVTRLTVNDNGIDYHPAWSPDGSKIAFTSNRSANPTDPADPTCYDQALEIWVMNADGSGLRNLTNHCRGDVWPAWSPDGSEIILGSDRGSTTRYAWDLWKIPSGGGTTIRMTTTGKEATPAWP